jgi:hypothetical protein
MSQGDPEQLLSQALRAHAASAAGFPSSQQGAPQQQWMPAPVRPQPKLGTSAASLLFGAILLGLLIGVIAAGLSVK